jgi:hypothetical protein
MKSKGEEKMQGVRHHFKSLGKYKRSSSRTGEVEISRITLKAPWFVQLEILNPWQEQDVMCDKSLLQKPCDYSFSSPSRA